MMQNSHIIMSSYIVVMNQAHRIFLFRIYSKIVHGTRDSALDHCTNV